jgi:hypothetical protein
MSQDIPNMTVEELLRRLGDSNSVLTDQLRASIRTGKSQDFQTS